VIGAGQAGWGTDQAYQYYTYEGRRYEPDIVIYQLITNDIADNARNTFYPGSKFRQHFDLDNGHLVELTDELSARPGREVLVAFHRRLYFTSRLYALSQMLAGWSPTVGPPEHCHELRQQSGPVVD
jgi:hypothetical protein